MDFILVEDFFPRNVKQFATSRIGGRPRDDNPLSGRLHLFSPVGIIFAYRYFAAPAVLTETE